METKFMKVLPLAGLLCSCLFGAQQSDDMDHQRRPAGHMQDDGRYREITPNAGPRVTNGADVYIDADFIWWRVHQDGMGYVFNGFGSTTAPNRLAGSGSVQHPGANWEPGFKVSLGVALGHDGWDLGAEYTWLNPGRSSSSVAGTSTNGLYPMWNVCNDFNSPVMSVPGSGAVGNVLSASSKWKTTFNVIDLELGRNFFVSQHLKLRPHIGFKGAWQNQDYSVTYVSRGNALNADNQRQSKRKMTNNQDYWGFGIRTGLDTAWHFTKSWSIYGDFAVSAMWSQFKVSRKDTKYTIPEASNTVYTIFNYNNNFHTIKPVMEWGIGLRWETWFSDDDYHFLIQAGWEEQYWTEMNQHMHNMEESNHGDMDLMGLTVKFRFDF